MHGMASHGVAWAVCNHAPPILTPDHVVVCLSVTLVAYSPTYSARFFFLFRRVAVVCCLEPQYRGCTNGRPKNKLGRELVHTWMEQSAWLHLAERNDPDQSQHTADWLVHGREGNPGTHQLGNFKITNSHGSCSCNFFYLITEDKKKIVPAFLQFPAYTYYKSR